MKPVASTETIGLLAGWGQFPIAVAQSLKSQGYRICCAAILGHADDELASICDEYRVFGMGRMGAQARFFRRCGVRRATMAGKIFKTLLFRRWTWFHHFPDLTFWRYFYPVFVTGSKDGRDDTLLTTVTELYSGSGIEFQPATDFAPELLVKESVMTKRQPSSAQWKDIQFGWEMAKQMGDLDIGQSVVVKNQTVLAVEAIEGTDECIRRAGQLCPNGGFVVVKVAKPKQDMRFDVPTIGCGTIRSIHEAGGKLLAIEAEKTIVLEQSEVVEYANQVGVTIVATGSGQATQSNPLAAVG